MAVTKRVYRICESYFKDPSKKIAELGAQYVMEEEWGGYGPPYFKDVFSHLDITSFDVTGEHNSVKLNLSNPASAWNNMYDIITNFGTTEHVQNQWVCWKNIFDMCKEGGIVISEIPRKGHWPGHCKYFYDVDTFQSLSKDFEIVDTRYVTYEGHNTGDLIYCVLKKKHTGSFLTTENDLLSSMQIDQGYIDKQGA